MEVSVQYYGFAVHGIAGAFMFDMDQILKSRSNVSDYSAKKRNSFVDSSKIAI